LAEFLRLPAEAIRRISEVEKEADKELSQTSRPQNPGNPDFVLSQTHINPACPKVIYLLCFDAKMAFDAQAQEYVQYHPKMVANGDLLGRRLTTKVVESFDFRWISGRYLYRKHLSAGSCRCQLHG